MKRLSKKSERPETVSNIRITKRSYGVYIYVVILAALPLWFGWIFLQDYFRFEAQGVVITANAAVESVVVSQINEVYVEPGAQVKKGEVLFKVTSLDHQTQIAALTAQLAGMKLGFEERVERANIAAAQVPVVTAELKRLNAHLKKLKKIRKAGLVENDQLEIAQRQIHALQQESAQLNSAAKYFSGGSDSIEELAARLDELNSTFADGAIRAAVDGIVAVEIAKPGEVVTVGERLMIINTGQPYVTAYLPEHYLCPISTGMTVHVIAGNASSSGTIIEILPLAERHLNDHELGFAQRAKPKRLAKISLPQPVTFSIGQQVTLSLSGRGLCFEPVFGWVTKRFQSGTSASFF